MEKKKIEMYYHPKTDTTWVNAEDWKERHKTEVISYGTVSLETDNVFEVKKTMNKLGFHSIKENPFRILNKATEFLKEKTE